MLEHIGFFIFVAFFTVEAVVKLYGMGVLAYFRSGWNQFDFFLVVVSFLQYIPVLSGYVSSDKVAIYTERDRAFVTDHHPPRSISHLSYAGLATIFRVFRVTRVMKLVKTSENLKKPEDRA